MTTKTFLADTPVGKIPMILYSPAIDKTGVCWVMFHGKGELGNGTLTSLNTLLNNGNHAELLKRVDTYGFSVLAPQVSTNLTGGLPWWSDPQIEAIIEYSVATHTKLGKVAVTGLSQGGGTCWEALTNEKCASKIFGAVPICPTSQYGDKITNKNDFTLIAKYGIAVWDFHGALDTVAHVSSSRNMVAEANRSNPDPKVKYTEYPSDNHYIWGKAWGTEEIYPYILSFAPKLTEPIPPVDPLPDEIIATYTIKTTVYKSGKIESVKL
jgi:predicted peptidase